MNINEILKSDYDLLCKDYKKATKKIEKQEQEIERLNNELQDFKVQDISNQEQLYNLIEENERLNNIIKTQMYCKYANNCDEIYDCTKEEYNTMCEKNMEMSLEITRLNNRIDKAIDYIMTNHCLHLLDKSIINSKELIDILKGSDSNE